MKNHLDTEYLTLLKKILEYGVTRNDRTNTGTVSLFGEQLYHPLHAGFPLLTSKKVSLKTVATELKWFLRGDTNIKYLQDNDCKIWDGDYEKSGRTDGELGPIYGKQWRDVNGIDQLANLMENIKNDPFSRRLIVNSWNVSELSQMTLPPCHFAFQVYVVEGHLDLLWTQRSADMFLGVPFNLASYGLLLLLLCHELNLKPGKIIGHFGDIHLYQNHLSQAYQQIKATTYELPQVKILSSDILKGEFEYELIDYKHSPVISAKLNN